MAKKKTTEPAALVPQVSDAPKDLRGKKHNGRPSNDERTTNEEIKKNLRLLTADLIQEIRRDLKKYSGKDKASLLSTCLRTLSLNDEEGRDEGDITFELLAKKYLKLKDDARKADLAIKQAMMPQEEEDDED